MWNCTTGKHFLSGFSVEEVWEKNQYFFLIPKNKCASSLVFNLRFELTIRLNSNICKIIPNSKIA